MRTLFLIVGFLFSITVSNAQDYKKHKVSSGETVYSISKKYDVSQEAIYKLNPDTKSGVAVGQIIIIPLESEDTEDIDDMVSFKEHKVKRKETLYSLSKKYEVSQDDIKKYNTILYSQPLKKGDKIKIPVFSEKEIELDEPTVSNDTILIVKQRKTIHLVKAKETKFGIAKHYGISVSELEEQNPIIKQGLKIGQELTIIKVEHVPTEDDGTPLAFNYYTVKDQDTFYSLEKTLGLTREMILKYNPKFSDGLKAGMLLKYPKNTNDISPSNTIGLDSLATNYSVGRVNLKDSISNYSKKKIALMLPLRLPTIPDSTKSAKVAYLEKDKLLDITLDFYTGVLMAVDSAKTMGISTALDVIDTENSYAKLSKLLEDQDFSEYDAVIGPVYPNNIEKVAEVLSENNVPVISPITTRTFKFSPNTYQSMPDKEVMRDSIIAYMQSIRKGENIVLITDSKSKDIQTRLEASFPNLSVMMANKDEYVVVDHIRKRLNRNQPNWVLIETQNNGLIVNAVAALNALKANFDIKLFATSNINGFTDNKDVYNSHLANLKFCFPTVALESFDDSDLSFDKKYKDRFNISPNWLAIRGFDLTLDLLLRLSAKEHFMEANELGETEYVENRFNYMANNTGGYINNAFYIAQYTEELTIEKIK